MIYIKQITLIYLNMTDTKRQLYTLYILYIRVEINNSRESGKAK